MIHRSNSTTVRFFESVERTLPLKRRGAGLLSSFRFLGADVVTSFLLRPESDSGAETGSFTFSFDGVLALPRRGVASPFDDADTDETASRLRSCGVPDVIEEGREGARGN